MSTDFAALLRTARPAEATDTEARRRLLRRLQLLAGLLRDAPSLPRGRRLLWRDVAGGVQVRPIAAPLVLGRDPACDIVVLQTRVSRRHARVWPSGNDDEFEDLGSSNGSRVNGRAVTRRTLREGDLLEMGGMAFVYVR
ncbi:MAG: FHA domain-containing protein [Verrucomicrobia bacterium]|nr:FHA domain-containing protein [Verrucomicrobiota bacterium]